jgi:hypothetical protein
VFKSPTQTHLTHLSCLNLLIEITQVAVLPGKQVDLKLVSLTNTDLLKKRNWQVDSPEIDTTKQTCTPFPDFVELDPSIFVMTSDLDDRTPTTTPTKYSLHKNSISACSN